MTAWETCDGLGGGEVTVQPPGGRWPPMVRIELYDDDVLAISDDVRTLAALLVAAADQADAYPKPRKEREAVAEYVCGGCGRTKRTTF